MDGLKTWMSEVCLETDGRVTFAPPDGRSRLRIFDGGARPHHALYPSATEFADSGCKPRTWQEQQE
jgi:hypothetical protein